MRDEDGVFFFRGWVEGGGGIEREIETWAAIEFGEAWVMLKEEGIWRYLTALRWRLLLYEKN